MTTKYPGRLLASLTLFLLVLPACAQEVHEIVLQVNTREIENPDINRSCTFGQAADTANEDYTITARVGDTIVWSGVSSDAPSEDRVEIRTINHRGDREGRDIFGSNLLRGENGVVRGVILNSTAGGPDYKYNLQFRVFNNGNRRGGNFNIDPKIKVVE